MKKSLIIFASLIVLIWLFISLRPSDMPRLPTDDHNKSSDRIEDIIPGITNVKGFSDAKKNNTSPSGNVNTGTTGYISKPLPYPRISINYSIQTASSIRENSAGANNTFIVAIVDIRNYGYRYFDAHSNNFRGVVRKNQIRPLVNISTGSMIDAVIPNNSRAKGNIIFLVDKDTYVGSIIYSPANKSESYYIIYKQMSQYDMEDRKQSIVDDEDV